MAENEVRHEGGEGKAEVPGWPVTNDTGLYDKIMLHLYPLEKFLVHLENREAAGGEEMGDALAGAIALALFRDFKANLNRDLDILEEHVGEPLFREYRYDVPDYEDKAGQVAAVVLGPSRAQREADNAQAAA